MNKLNYNIEKTSKSFFMKLFSIFKISFYLLSIKIFICSTIYANEPNISEASKNVPVKVTIPSFLNILLESHTTEIENPANKKTIPSGTLYFGSMNEDVIFSHKRKKKEKEKEKEKEYIFSTTLMTHTKVKIINNSKPFSLKIQILPSESEKTILDLKTNNKKKTNALHLKLSPIKDVTKNTHNLTSTNAWVPFPDNEEIFLYNSNNEIISDTFMVDFAIINLSSQTTSGHYSGTILWVIVPEF